MDFLTTVILIGAAAGALLMLHAITVVKRDNLAILDIYSEMLEAAQKAKLEEQSDGDDKDKKDADGDDEETEAKSAVTILPDIEDIAEPIGEFAQS